MRVWGWGGGGRKGADNCHVARPRRAPKLKLNCCATKDVAHRNNKHRGAMTRGPTQWETNLVLRRDGGARRGVYFDVAGRASDDGHLVHRVRVRPIVRRCGRRVHAHRVRGARVRDGVVTVVAVRMGRAGAPVGVRA